MEFEYSNASLLNTTTGSNSKSRANQSFNLSTFFNEDSDKFAQVFHDIFLDFHSICVEGGEFPDIVDKFRETASNGVLIFDKFSEGGIKGGKRVSNIKSVLQKERNAYDLILKLYYTEAISTDQEAETSVLRRLLKENVHFRKLITLLHWSEEVAFADPIGFSQLLTEIEEASKGHSFIDSVRKGNFAHADSCFTDELSNSDLEGLDRIKRVFFCLLRCGRFKKLNELLDITALSMLKTFVEVREVLTNPDLSPMEDSKAENYSFIEARLFLKNTVNMILSNPDDSITPIDQCIWATIAGNLPVLLAHSQEPEDILWSYVNCAVESIMDDASISARSVEDPDILESVESSDKIHKIDDVFIELMNHMNDSYYRLIGFIASGMLDLAVDFMYDECVGREVDPNILRLYAHIVLLIKNGYKHDPMKADAIIVEYTNLLSSLGLYSSVPHYLSKLNEQSGLNEMVNFLYELNGVQTRLDALQAAEETGVFDVGTLCIEVYNKAKNDNPFLDGQATPESVAKLMDVWKFLLIYPDKTSIEALVECNNVLRVRDRLGEAMELLAISEQNLVVLSERQVKQKLFNDDGNQDKLLRFVQDQQREFNSYILYLEIMDKFTVWQGKVKMQLPKQPEKISDSEYARLDLASRTEYDRKLNTAQERLVSHRSSLEKYQKSVIDQIHYLLSQTSTWMVCCLSDDEMDEIQEQRREQMLKVHERYLYYCFTMLITIYQDSRQESEALKVADILMDGRHDLFAQLSKESLRKLFEQISKSGHVISINVS